MADASRFPGLVVPFAIAAASAGWLSAGLLANPLVLSDPRFPLQPEAALVAAAMGALVGFVLRRACVERRCVYALDPPDPSTRAASDVWWLHVIVMLAAGSAAGAIVAAVCAHIRDPLGSAGIACECTLAFVPVGLAVLAAGRRAQRARLGSIVARSDRRAVFAILAIALGVSTLEALPDWPAAAAGKGPLPLDALALLAVAAAVVACVLALDRRDRARAEAAIAAIQTDHTHGDESDTLPRIDLGLGDDVGACVSPSRSPYRGRDETVGLVAGTPELVRAAFRRSIFRGAVGLAVLAAVSCGHIVAHATLREDAYSALRALRFQAEPDWNGKCTRVVAACHGANDR